MTAQARKKVLLMILDGWGIGAGNRADVIGSVAPQRLGELMKAYPTHSYVPMAKTSGCPTARWGTAKSAT